MQFLHSSPFPAFRMAWNLLVHNGVLQALDPGPAASFLLSRPPGAYTTTRTANNASCLLLWERHLARLAQSIQLLFTEPLQSLSHQPSELSWCDFSLKDLVQPCMEVGLQRAMELRRNGQEVVVTTFVDGFAKSEEMKGPGIYVHLSSCDRVGSITPARLAVMGPARNVPSAKSSQWVRSRQMLEQVRPPNVTEILLSNDGNSLLEGTITNFFVVCSNKMHMNAKGREGAIEDERLKPWTDSEIHTAPLGEVLPGIIRQLIIAICEEEGICLREVTPQWADRHLWKEAFITNSVRLVQPVQSLQAPLTSASQTTWEHFSLEATGKITQVVQELVWQKALTESIPIRSFVIGNF